MTDAELTVTTVRAKGWECVRLAPRAKKPDGPSAPSRIES